MTEITKTYPGILNYKDSKSTIKDNTKQPSNQLMLNDVVNFIFENEALLKQDNKWNTYIENIELPAVNTYITKNLK